MGHQLTAGRLLLKESPEHKFIGYMIVVVGIRVSRLRKTEIHIALEVWPVSSSRKEYIRGWGALWNQDCMAGDTHIIRAYKSSCNACLWDWAIHTHMGWEHGPPSSMLARLLELAHEGRNLARQYYCKISELSGGRICITQYLLFGFWFFSPTSTLSVHLKRGLI